MTASRGAGARDRPPPRPRAGHCGARVEHPSAAARACEPPARVLGCPPRASGRRRALARGIAELASSIRQLPLELANLLGGTLGRRRALLGLAPARFGLLGAARALGLFLGALGLGLIAWAVRALAAAQQP